MSSSATVEPIQEESSENNSIVPYFGRNGIVSVKDIHYQTVINSLLEINKELCHNSGNDDQLWSNLSNEVGNFVEDLLNVERPVRRYQLDIVSEVVIPYLKEIQGPRLYVDKSRFVQLPSILRLLREPSDTRVGGDVRPYHVLIRLETLIKEINSQRYLWKSKLVTSLEAAVQKQWEPIIRDHQRTLQTVGSQLFAIGLVEVLGRPIAMLYPLYLAAQDVLNIATEFEVKKTVSLSSILQLGKLFVMTMAILQITNILAMYSGLGYTSLGMGIFALFISTNDELTKHFVPIIAPQIAQAGVFIAKLSQLEKLALSTLNVTSRPVGAAPSSSTSSSSSSSSSPTALPTDPRVEELPDDEPAPAVLTARRVLVPPAAQGTVVGVTAERVALLSSSPVVTSSPSLGGDDDYVFAEVVDADNAGFPLADSAAAGAGVIGGDGLRQRRR